jgi:hypothetical protein
MRCHCTVLIAAGVLAAFLPGCNSDEKASEPAAVTPAEPLTVRDSIDVSVSARVKAIDYASRVVTLQDGGGHEITFVAGPAVQRLGEVRVGDDVNARYRATLLAELRAPTAEESANPISIVTMGGRAPKESDPAAGAVQAVRVVTTVAAVDQPNMLVTLRGPMGELAVVKGRNPENVKRLKVGDTIVVTYSESVAIALDKIAAR